MENEDHSQMPVSSGNDTVPALSAKPETTASEPVSPPAPAAKPRHEGWRSVLSTLAIIAIAPIIALALTAFVFQSYEVDGPSMETTLQNHDRLIVLKLARTWSKITKHSYIPKRGQVVIFTVKGLVDSRDGQQKQLIKRVIGLPGDRVVVRDGILTIYNAEHPEGYQPDKTLEHPEGINPVTPGNIDLTVPANEIFVCGDNRGNSLDSRVFGTVPVKEIVGRLALRVAPLNKATHY